jgi:ATP/maltotriose-dependent transcriptional regulator MalT
VAGRDAPPSFAATTPTFWLPPCAMTDNGLAMHLLERQGPLEILNRCLQEARAGSGKLVLVAAEAGLGKSSLVERFAADHRRDARTLWGACDGFATPRALAPVYEIAAQTVMSSGGVKPDEESRDRLFRSLLEELAGPERVTMIVLEDLHWADEATLDFLLYIGRRIQRTSAVFVATYRDDEFSENHPVRLALGELTGHHVIRIHLSPLSPAAVEMLAKDSGRDVALLHRVTGGNPFFVREVLASTGERVPETVRDAVLARLARCSPATRDLAEFVSLSPAKTESWLIDSLLGEHQGAADEAGARGLLSVQSDCVGFRHELARLAVHSTIPRERVRSMHDRVLQALCGHGSNLTRLIHHATLADNAAVVLEYAPLAAKEAARLGAHREAAAHLSAALRYRNSLAMQVQAALLEHHALECSLANQTRDAIASATEAVAAWHQVGDVVAQSRLWSFLTQEYRTVGDKGRADECVEGAIALLEALPPGTDLAMAYSARALLAVNRGWDRETLEFGRRALALAREFGDHAAESHALCNIGSAILGTGDYAGYQPLEQSLALALEHGLEEYAARAYRSMLFYAVLIHDFSRAERLFREGVAYCEERGIFSHSAYMRAYYIPYELDRGNWTEAARMANELMRSIEITGVQQRITILATLALVRLRRGDPGIDALLDEALALALPTSELNRIGRVAAARAECAWLRGDIGEAAREAATGLDSVRGHTAPWIKGELLLWLSRAQAIDPLPTDIAEPYRLMLAGHWREAAAAWQALGMPYEQALALTEGPEAALREALAILDKLGAAPLAVIVRRRLRERGVRSIPRGPNETTRANPAGLTAKETEVLALLAHGSSNAQLARRLHRSTKTIDHHVSAILEKLGVRSRAEAVAAAFALGVIHAGNGGPAPPRGVTDCRGVHPEIPNGARLRKGR